MAKQNFMVDIDLNNNQLLNGTLQNLSTAPSTAGINAGFIYFNTTTKAFNVYSGKPAPNEWITVDGMAGYVHPVTGDLNPNLSGAKVLASLTVNAEGHVTAATTRILTAANIGAAPTSHTHTISQVTDVTASADELNLLKLAGRTAGDVLRATTATQAAWGKLLGSQITNDLNWVKIADNLTNATDTWSSSKIQSLIDDINTTITGGLVNKGGYNAATNTPNLDTGTLPVGMKNGWSYVITVGGVFFTEDVQAGDMIIANRDNPVSLSHWTIVNKNIPDIVDASTTEKGILKLATNYEAKAGVNGFVAITPVTLAARTATETRTGIIALATPDEVNAGTVDDKAITPATLESWNNSRSYKKGYTFGDGVATSFAFNHNLGQFYTLTQIQKVSTGETVQMQVVNTTFNQIVISCNTPPTTGEYRVTIIK